MRNQLQYFEKKDLSPIDIVYEPTLDTKKPILCFYALEIYMAYQTCYEKMRMGGKINVSSTARQCPYRNNFFIKTAEKMEKHISCCSGQADSNFSFDNGKVIDYQDNYKKIGDLPLAIYYDFETTTGCVVFFDANIYVVSYCIIVAFHPDVDLPRLYIFRSYDQTREQLRILRQFKGIFFADKLNFNQKTFAQLQDVGFAVENREKNTALSEMFSIKLKFTVDCLKSWFERNKNILEVDRVKRIIFIRDTPKIDCCLCDFPLQSRAKNGWCQHNFKAEYLFLENIYDANEMYQMGIDNFEVYCQKLNQILDQVDSFCGTV